MTDADGPMVSGLLWRWAKIALAYLAMPASLILVSFVLFLGDPEGPAAPEPWLLVLLAGGMLSGLAFGVLARPAALRHVGACAIVLMLVTSYEPDLQTMVATFVAGQLVTAGLHQYVDGRRRDAKAIREALNESRK